MYGSCKFSPCVAAKYKEIWYVLQALFINLFSKVFVWIGCLLWFPFYLSQGRLSACARRDIKARWSGDGHRTCLEQTPGASSFQPNLSAQFAFHSPCQQDFTMVLINTAKCQECCLDPNPDGVTLDFILGICIFLETVVILKIIFLAPTIGWQLYRHFTVITQMTLFAFGRFCCPSPCSFSAFPHLISFPKTGLDQDSVSFARNLMFFGDKQVRKSSVFFCHTSIYWLKETVCEAYSNTWREKSGHGSWAVFSSCDKDKNILVLFWT